MSSGIKIMAPDIPSRDEISEAVYKVLRTVELLEIILLELDIKTVLLSQRVDKTFEATIASSSKLQQALFFKRDPDPDPIKKEGVVQLAHRNTFLIELNFGLGENIQVKTPEGYNLMIVDRPTDPCFYICFDGQLPMTELPATGSWRKMHAWKGTIRRNEVDVMADGVGFFVELPERLQLAAVGDVLEYALERYRSGDEGDDIRIWE